MSLLSCQVTEPAHNAARLPTVAGGVVTETAAILVRQSGAFVHYVTGGYLYEDYIPPLTVALVWGMPGVNVFDSTQQTYVSFIIAQFGHAATLYVTPSANLATVAATNLVIPIDNIWRHMLTYWQPRGALAAPAHSWSGQTAVGGLQLGFGGSNYVGGFLQYFQIPSVPPGGEMALASLTGTLNGHAFYLTFTISTGAVLNAWGQFTSSSGVTSTFGSKSMQTVYYFAGDYTENAGPLFKGEWYCLSLTSAAGRDTGPAAQSELGFYATLTRVSNGWTTYQPNQMTVVAIETLSYTLPTSVAVTLTLGHDATGVTSFADWPDTDGWLMSKGIWIYKTVTPAVVGSVTSWLLSPGPSYADPAPSADYEGLWLVNAGETVGAVASIADDNTGYTSTALSTITSATLRTGSPYVPTSAYAGAVLADSPVRYYRLGDLPGQGYGDQPIWDAVSQTFPTFDTGYFAMNVAGLILDNDGAIFFDPGSPSGGANISMVYTQTAITALSLECWVKTNTAPTAAQPLMGPIDDGGAPLLVLYLGSPASGVGGATGQVTCGLWYRGTNDWVGVHSVAYVNDNLPHHIVGVWSGTPSVAAVPGDFTIYIDGYPATVTQQSQGSAITPPITAHGSLNMGLDSNVNYYNGVLDEAAIYPAALSAPRVQAHYLAGIYPSGNYAGWLRYNLQVMADGPLRYYPMNDGDITGAEIYDVMNSGFNLAKSGTILYGQAGPGGAAAMTFDGLSGYLGGGANGLPTSGPYTVEVWVLTPNSGSTGTSMTAVGWGPNSYNGTSPADVENTVRLSGAGTAPNAALSVQWGNDGANSSTITSFDGTWHQLVSTWDGTSRTMYCDTVNVLTNTPSGSPNFDDTNFSIGAQPWYTGATRWFAGSICRVSVYAFALTPTQIGNHYLLGTTV